MFDNSQFFSGGAAGFYDFPLEQSLRFNDDDSAYLSWTPDSAGNRKTWTWSAWVKRCNIGSGQTLFSCHTSGSVANAFQFLFDSGDNLNINGYTTVFRDTTAVYRDPSAWYHIVLAVDTTQATASDRIKIYVNGEQVTSFATSNDYSASADTGINQASRHTIGAYDNGLGDKLDGYMAEVNFIDGTALDADSFGETKNGVWIPKDPSGLTYGTNGFRLSFADDAEVEAFNTVLYRGNGGTQSVTGYGFEPDVVWIKERSSTSGHVIFDQVRGATKSLFPDNTGAESTTSTQLTSFDSDGFTTGSSGGTNENGQTYVAWGWKAGDSNVSNTDGSISSTVRANTTYGFSIVSYTGNGSASQTVGHGLGSAPTNWMVILKNRTSGSTDWPVFHSAISSGRLKLNTTDDDFGNYPISFNTDTITLPSVSDLAWSSSSNDYIAYCWAEKAGYSKFGSYAGNATSVDLGFNPAFIVIKRITGTGKDWWVFDNTREVDGEFGNYLLPNQNYSEQTVATAISVSGNTITFPNNWDSSHDGSSSSTYIYAAFADTREAAFWLDQSGNDNDWQPVNLDHNDTVADSPTDNFATLNPLQMSNNDGNFFLSDGNLQLNSANNDAYRNVSATFSPEGFKGYLEVTYLNTPNSKVGFEDVLYAPNKNGYAESTYDTVHIANNGDLKNNTTTLTSGITGAFGAGDVLNVAFDFTDGNRNVWFGKNDDYGTGNPSAGTGAHVTSATLDANEYRFYFAVNNGCDISVNFGQQPFKYDPPA